MDAQEWNKSLDRIELLIVELIDFLKNRPRFLAPAATTTPPPAIAATPPPTTAIKAPSPTSARPPVATPKPAKPPQTKSNSRHADRFTKFISPFVCSHGCIPGTQAPSHMVVSNLYAPHGLFGHVGLSFMEDPPETEWRPPWRSLRRIQMTPGKTEWRPPWCLAKSLPIILEDKDTSTGVE
ncbi:uncharacterized protein LOC118481171 [Helianthus annuus]|uniref:uncharacterized protein LOC118481171 n=1 Tax=Helianthus annuus TaxID=4232 RepID=UPI001653135B|nr:uncharacterized protein LOC118481171 [Helianthus annuus]